MELQAASPVLMDALRAVAGSEATITATVKDVRTESLRMPYARPMVKAIAEETMIPDLRAGLSPAQSVERKLSSMLRGGAAMPVSHYRLAKLCRKC